MTDRTITIRDNTFEPLSGNSRQREKADARYIRLACLKLAVGAAVDDAVAVARKYESYVLGADAAPAELRGVAGADQNPWLDLERELGGGSRD